MPPVNPVDPRFHFPQPWLYYRPSSHRKALSPSIFIVCSTSPPHHHLTPRHCNELLRVIIRRQPPRQILPVTVQISRSRVLCMPYRRRVVRPKIVTTIPRPLHRQRKPLYFAHPFVKRVVYLARRLLEHPPVEQVELPPRHRGSRPLVLLLRKRRVVYAVSLDYFYVGRPSRPPIVDFRLEPPPLVWRRRPQYPALRQTYPPQYRLPCLPLKLVLPQLIAPRRLRRRTLYRLRIRRTPKHHPPRGTPTLPLVTLKYLLSLPPFP